MATQITIAELNLNTEAFAKAAEETKKAIDKIVLSQKELKKNSKENVSQISKNEAALKGLRSEYNKQKNVLSNLIDVNGELVVVEKAISNAINKNIKTIQQARDSNSKLLKIRNQLNLSTKNGRDALSKINTKLDQNNKFIEKNTSKLEKQKIGIGRYGDAIKNVTARFLGWTAVIMGTIRVLKNMFKTVVDFDKQLIAVGKTTNLSKKELSNFGQQVIVLGKELKGISTQQLLETAEVAGQLGIRGSENILRFAETIEKLGLTSDIIGQEAARNFAKFIEVSSDSVQNADRLGSVITELGNNFATTEGEILKNTTEIQKGIAIYNTSAQSVLALGAATSALGSQAEASRGALQSTFKVLNKAATSGENLEQILKLTGQTQAEFVSEFGTDAAATFQRFIKGLSDSSDQGINLSNTLSSLNLDQKRVEAVVGSLAKNYDVLEGAMNSANTEYTNNTALNTEAEAASKSLSSQIGDLEDAWNNLTLAIESGEGALAGFVRSTVTGLTTVLNDFSDFSLVSEKEDNLFSNIFKSLFSTDFEAAILAEAKLIRGQREHLSLANELAVMLGVQQEKLGGVIDVQETANRLSKESTEFLKDQIRFQGELLIKEEEAAKEKERLALEALNRKKALTKEEKRELKKQQEQEKKDLATFEQEKIDLQNEIDLRKIEDEFAKAELKAIQKKDKDLLELEELQISEELKNEQEALILENHELRLQEIRNAAVEEELRVNEKSKQDKKKVEDKWAKQEIKAEKQLADTKVKIQQQVTKLLTGLLGDSLAARIANAIGDAFVAIGRVKAETAAAKATNLAIATAKSEVDPFAIKRATARNIRLGIFSKIQQGLIVANGIASISKASAFYDGGQVGGEANIPSNMRNKGGDDVLIQAKRGEVILNEQQQARAGGSAFFNSIGVPGFANGGIVSSSTITQPITQSGIDAGQINELFQDTIKKVQIVASAEDITGIQTQTVEIIDGANI